MQYLHALHSSGCLKGNAKPLSIAAILIADSLVIVHWLSYGRNILKISNIYVFTKIVKYIKNTK